MARVHLERRQAIELRYTAPDGPGVIELYWRPPNGQRGLIPPGAFRAPSGV